MSFTSSAERQHRPLDAATARSASLVHHVALVALGGAGVGVLTSFGQTSLPFELSPLANSAGSWSLATFLLALVEVVPRRAAILGGIALATMLAGYAVATQLRGFAVGTPLLVFWGFASIAVGPALGVGSAWFRGRDEVRIAAASALIAGILVGEGMYGLTVVADTTPALYWVGEFVVGLGLAVLAFVWRLRTVTHRAIGAVLTIIVATAFYVTYSMSLIGLL
jgi:hypothetical protein